MIDDCDFLSPAMNGVFDRLGPCEIEVDETDVALPAAELRDSFLSAVKPSS